MTSGRMGHGSPSEVHGAECADIALNISEVPPHDFGGFFFAINDKKTWLCIQPTHPTDAVNAIEMILSSWRNGDLQSLSQVHKLATTLSQVHKLALLSPKSTSWHQSPQAGTKVHKLAPSPQAGTKVHKLAQKSTSWHIYSSISVRDISRRISRQYLTSRSRQYV